MILSSGDNIAVPEVEGALLRHPAVAEYAVVGLPDERRRQLVSAFVVLAPDHPPGDLLKTATGKVQSFQLRQIP